MVTRTVVNTGDPITTPDGSLKSGLDITFQLVDAATRHPAVLCDAAEDGGELVVGDIITATTDEAGQFSVELWPNNRGEIATLYKVRLPSGVAGGPAKPFYIRVTEGDGELTLVAAKAAMEAVQPQTLSLFDALLASIASMVGTVTAVATETVNGLMSYVDKVRFNLMWSECVRAESFGSLSDAVAFIGGSKATLKFSTDQTLTANLTVPANIELAPVNGAKIIHGAYTISYAGSTSRWPVALVISGTGAVSLPNAGISYPEWLGAVSGTTDNTAAYSRLIGAVPAGSTVRFTKGPYSGTFASTKAIALDVGGQTIKPSPADDSAAPISFTGTAAQITTLTANTAYGQTSISVADGTGIVPGDLLLLVDGKTRPSDSLAGVNTELVKVAAVSGNTVTVQDMVRSVQDTGTKNVYKITPVVRASVVNAKLDMGATSTAPGVYFRYCSEPSTHNVEVTNNIGHAIRFEATYGARAYDSYPVSPRGIGSGEGYGVTVLDSRLARVRGVYGRATRHPLDISSSYDVQAYDINDTEGSSAASVPLAHNTFGGMVSVEKVRIKSDNYAVVWSAQGVATAANYIARDVTIKDIEHVAPTKKTDEALISAYIQTGFANLVIDGVTARYIDTSSTPSLASAVVRLNGMCNGPSTISNIRANEVGALVGHKVATTSAPKTNDYLTIRGAHAARVYRALWLSGGLNYIVDDMVTPTVEATAAVLAEKSGTYNPGTIVFGNGFKTDVAKLIVELVGFSINRLQGSFPLVAGYATTNVVDAGTVTDLSIQHNGGYLHLSSPTTAAITLNATDTFAPPIFAGQRVKVLVNPLRGNVTIPAASDRVYTDGAAPITMTKGKAYELIGDATAGRWFVQGI